MTDTTEELEVWKARSLTLRRIVLEKDRELTAVRKCLEVAERSVVLWRQIAKNVLDATGLVVQWCPECLAVRLSADAERVDGCSVLGKLCPTCLARSNNPWETKTND